MALPHFQHPIVIPDQIQSNNFDVKFYDEYGLEMANVYASSINITEQDYSNSIISTNDEIIRKMTLSITSNIKFIADFKNTSNIKYCYFSVYDKTGEILSGKIFKLKLISLQSKFNYSMDTSFQENDCEFLIKKEYDITNRDINVDSAIKIILRSNKIDNILGN